jgi:hypothetical protein
VLKPAPREHSEDAIESAVIDGVLWITVHGPITRDVGDAVMARLNALARAYQSSLWLLDFRAASLVEGTVSLIGRVKAVDADDLLRDGHAAIVCAVRTNDYAFLESTANQHGHSLKVFTDGARAMEWLRSRSPA